MTIGSIELFFKTTQSFLINDPEINLFRITYTVNHQIHNDLIRLKFDNSVGFGKTNTIKIPAYGDLLSNIYIEIILPKFNIHKNNNKCDENIIKLKNKYKKNKHIYHILQKIYDILLLIYYKYVNNKVHNICESNKIIKKILFENNILFNEMSNIDEDYNIYHILEYDDNEMENKNINILTKMLLLKNKTLTYVNTYYNKYINNKCLYKKSLCEEIYVNWINKIGILLINYVEIKIGDIVIDKHYNNWLNIYNNLNQTNMNYLRWIDMIGYNLNSKESHTLFIPLNFWFCNHLSQAYPLFASNKQTVSLEIKFNKFKDVVCNVDDSELYLKYNFDINANLLVKYISISNTEKLTYLEKEHEYIITQTQMIKQINNTNIINVDLSPFSNSISSLYWVIFNNNSNNTFDYIPIENAEILYNNNVRVLKSSSEYFNYLQPYYYYIRSPEDYIYVYSFSEYNNKYNPSGYVNLTDNNAKLIINMNEHCKDNSIFSIIVFANSYNILTISNNRTTLLNIY